MTTITIFKDTSWSYGAVEACCSICSMATVTYWCKYMCKRNVCGTCWQDNTRGCKACFQETTEGP